MHYVRNGPESQLWLFQFHECYFFIKAKEEGAKYCFCPKKKKKKKNTKKVVGRPYQQARLLKMVWNRLGNWDSIYLPSR